MKRNNVWRQVTAGFLGLVGGLGLLGCGADSLYADFPQFRGTHGWGIAEQTPLPQEWSSEKNLAWRCKVPGAGWSAPVVVGQRLYVTSAVAAEPLKPKSFADGVRTPQSMGLGFLSQAPDVNIDWTVFCLDADSGQILWSTVVASGKPQFAIHPSNSYATETPVANADGVVAYFGATGKVAGLSTTGELLWQQDVGVYKTSNGFGTGSSLAIHDGRVFVQNFSEGSAAVVGFDFKTGGELWKYQRDRHQTSWSSPLVWNNVQRTELIISGGEQIDSLDPATGSLLWTVRNVKAATACSVAADRQRIYFGGSDPFSSGPLFAVRTGGNGDISPTKKNESFEFCQWMQKRAAPGMASPVSSGELVYVAEKNILRCYSAETGERMYQERVPGLEMVNASPLIVGEQLLLVDEKGQACLVDIGPTFQVSGRGSIDDVFWATPAVANGAVYLRGLEALYCIRAPR